MPLAVLPVSRAIDTLSLSLPFEKRWILEESNVTNVASAIRRRRENGRLDDRNNPFCKEKNNKIRPSLVRLAPARINFSIATIMQYIAIGLRKGCAQLLD